MLVKYLGTKYDKDSDQWMPRSEFLENGLFRMTQPKFLNDRSSEAKFYPYLDEFSPADLAYARKCSSSFDTDSKVNQLSHEDLIRLHLEPSGDRYTLENTPTLLGFTEYNSVEEYNKAQKRNLEKAVKEFNSFILEALSCHIGVFSLSKNASNILMWTHYANQGMGLAVSFKEEHPFFKKFGLQDVSYRPEDRASITYYKGTTRINGEYSDNFQLEEGMSLLGLYKLVLQEKTRYNDLIRKLIYSKSEDWKYEQEKRIICPLVLCEEKLGKTIEPSFELEISDNLAIDFCSYSEVCLKKVPFSAFDSIIFGDAVSNLQKEIIIRKAKKNPALSHLKFKQADFDIRGEIVIKDL
tara:strand:+ start:124 stop:1182 length:1059 start_codon:yes stop_codon:yes gene_type:complete